MKDEQFNQMPQLDRIEYLQNFLFNKVRLMFLCALGIPVILLSGVLAMFGLNANACLVLLVFGSLLCSIVPWILQQQFKNKIEARFIKKNNLDAKPKEVLK